MKIFAGSSNLPLAQEIAQYCKKFLGNSVLERFSDGEIHYYIDENVRGEDVFIIQSGCYPANAHMMELFLMIDAFKRSSAERITAVMPYYAYARQDWKDRPAGAHLGPPDGRPSGSGRGQPHPDHGPAFAPDPGLLLRPRGQPDQRPRPGPAHAQGLGLGELTVVSPDAGGVGRAKHFAKKLGAKLAIIDKRRPAPQRGRGVQRHRRRHGPDLRHLRRHGRHGRDAGPGRRGPGQVRGQAASWPRDPPRALGPGRWRRSRLAHRTAYRPNTIPLNDASGAARRSSRCPWPRYSAKPSGGSMSGNSVSSLFD